MSDDESAYSDAERRKKGDEGANFLKNRQQMKMSELDEQLAEYIAEWRKQRAKEEDELRKLKDKQAKRKVLRAEEEKKLTEQKKAEEERKMREETERKQREQEEKRKRLEEAEKKRQALMKGTMGEEGGGKKFSRRGGGDKLSNIQAAKGELGKTREQLAEEKKIALSIRVKPLNIDGIGSANLRSKAEDMWNLIVKLETEKYDMEERMKRQDYDLKELKERQKQQLRQKALKRGLDAEALTGKHPPKIQTASKFERRTDRRTYDDKKKLFEGGIVSTTKEEKEKKWNDLKSQFEARQKSKLPKWFGERPGKKAGDPESPEEAEVEEEEEEEE